MKQGRALWISLFVLFFAFAALADDKDKAPDPNADKGPHGEEGDKTKRADDKSPVTDVDKFQTEHEDFLKKWFPLTKEQPKIFAEMIAKNSKEAGTALGQLMGAIENDEIKKMLDEDLNKKLEDKDLKDKDFYQRIKDAALIETEKKSPDDKDLETAFNEARKKKQKQTDDYKKYTEMLQSDPSKREVALKGLADAGFKPEQYLAYAKHYGSKGDTASIAKAATAFDAAGTVDKDGRIWVNIQDDKNPELTHSYSLGTTETPWEDKDGKKGRGSLARTAAPLVAQQFEKAPYMQPQATPGDKRTYYVPTPAKDDKDKPTLEKIEADKIDAAIPKPTKPAVADVDPASLIKGDVPKEVAAIFNDEGKCKTCHDSDEAGPHQKLELKAKLPGALAKFQARMKPEAFDKMLKDEGKFRKDSQADYDAIVAWVAAQK